ncbi:DNA polymerase III subunit epsilon [Candidatus Paracaedibacter symbiosus]|uniref:DNA polymerase III subunit epsilon n=1 Tax=Candidatus Paracaedibacter symbiosus TaxID=244582 RepID=UPI000A4C651A|nr:DNA polymerase III subunit epsilon [Candidatus Paracaedibacter symbiosus]
MAEKMIREIVLDTETTGLTPRDGDRIVEIGGIELINHLPTGKIFHKHINPQRDIPEESTRVHGITNEMVKDAPLFVHIVEEFLEFIDEAPLIIHNASFDMGFLNAELDRLCRPMLEMSRAIDTLKMARQKFPGSPASLDALCRRFNIDLSVRTTHGAWIDAELLAKVYLELIGGRQVSFQFQADGQKEAATIEFKDILNLQKAFRPSRQYKLSDAEKQAHEEFLKGIKNSLWEEFYT